MSLLKRIEKLESQFTAKSDRDGSGDCICFPEGRCGELASQEDFEAARGVKCPETRKPTGRNNLWCFIQTALGSPRTWESCWEHYDAQTRKAMLATYPGWPLEPERYVDRKSYLSKRRTDTDTSNP
jgi:hypothetical protein